MDNTFRKMILVLGMIFLLAIVLSPKITSPASENSSISKPQGLVQTPVIVSTASSYQIRTPDSYNLESQPVTVYGDLSRLLSEDLAMIFYQDFSGASSASTYVIYTISTAGMTINDLDTLIISWETWGIGGPDLFSTQKTNITIFILFQSAQWIPIHTITTPENQIDWNNGWGAYTLVAPYTDYIASDEIQVKIEISSQLTQPLDWSQFLYVNWLGLEFQNNVAINQIIPSSITLLSPGFTSTGNLTALDIEDNQCYEMRRITSSGESKHLQVQLTFELGLYDLDDIYGIRLSHADWLSINGSCITKGQIFVIGDQGNQFLCLTRDPPNNKVTPNTNHGTFMVTGNWSRNGSIQLLYDFEYIVYQTSLINAHLDWAFLQIVRNPEIIVVGEVLNTTIYAGQDACLSITCLDGKASITKIILSPWNDTVGTSAGTYIYSKHLSIAGTIPTSLFITDSDNNTFELSLIDIEVLHRPVSIALFLSEDPLLQEVIIQLYIKDIFSNTPLPLHPFTKTIYKNGIWFRQQNHQTTISGTFEIHEYVMDYLNYTYTVEITTAETPVHESSTVYAAIKLVKCPPYIYIDQVDHEEPLKANDYISLNYTVFCQIPIDHLLLYRNGTPIRTIYPQLGSHCINFQDISGFWEYVLYANNSMGYQGFSLPFYLNITPLETRLELESTLDIEDHAIILNIKLLDELNRTCINVPLTVNIFDFGKPFFTREVITGMDGIQLIIHFDQYLDHEFTLTIASESTSLYSGAITTEQDLVYEGYPLYSIMGLGIAVGCVSITLAIIRRRLRIS